MFRFLLLARNSRYFLHIHFNKYDDDTVNDTLFSLIEQNNKITAAEIGERLKISLSTVKRRLKTLRESGKIERVGSDKTGWWKIIEK